MSIYDITIARNGNNCSQNAIPIPPLPLFTLWDSNANSKQRLLEAASPRGTPMNDVHDRLSGLDLVSLMILRVVGSHSKPTKAIEIQKDLESAGVSLSRSALLSRTVGLHSDNLLLREEIPHRNPGMPPTFFFRLSPDLSISDLKKALNTISPRFKLQEDQLEAEPPLQQVESALSSLRPSVRSKYIQLLLLVAGFGPLTMNEAASRQDGNKQTTHSRLERLRELGLLKREKRSTGSTREFFYSLALEINQDNIDTLRKKYALPEITPESITAQAEVPDAMNRNDRSSFESLGSHRLAPQTQLPKLPEYDSSWPDDLKKAWFSAYQELLKRGSSN